MDEEHLGVDKSNSNEAIAAATAGVTKFTKSLTLFIPSYDEDSSSKTMTTTERLISTAASASDLNHFSISSPDSAFHTGSEFNVTEDSFDQNSNAIRNDKVERWVKTTATANIGQAADAHAHSSDDYEDILSVGSQVSFNIQTPPSIVPRQKIVIEEHVEEIFTRNSYEDSDQDSSVTADSEKSGSSGSGSSDIGDSDTDDFMDTHTHTTIHPMSWEHNWLFKKKKFRQPRGLNGTQKFRTTMFIPNPLNYSTSQYIVDEEELDENEDLSLESIELLETESEEEVAEVNERDSVETGASIPVKFKETQRRPSNEKIKHNEITVQRTRSNQVDPNTEPLQNFNESIEETLRETSQSLIASNDTIEFKNEAPKTAAVSVNSTSTPRGEPSSGKLPKLETITQSRLKTQTNLQPKTQIETKDSEFVENSSTPLSIFEDSPGAMRIAEREKQKWNNPVKISNNPYTPENLLRRITNNSFLHCHEVMGGQIEVEADELVSGDFSAPLDSLSSNQKIRRDYYVNTEQSPSQSQGLQFSRTSSSSYMNFDQKNYNSTKTDRNVNPSNLVTFSSTSVNNGGTLRNIKLPSVRNLAQQFTDTPSPASAPTMTPRTTKARDRARKAFEPRPFANPMKEIHSLTARSVPKQFREGLRLAKSPVSNPNIK